MPYIVTKYPQGTFSWADVSTHDIAATTAFMTSLLGWTAEAMPTGQPGMDYTMFSLQGKYVAGASPMAPGMEQVPSMWNNFVSVDNLDAMVTKAQTLGATVFLPAMDVLDSGRMAGIQDPRGARLFLWQPGKHIGAGLVNTVGAMSWNELYTSDVNASMDFYSKLLEWTFAPSAENSDYMVIYNNGRPNGGIMQITAEMAPMPPMWMVYFTIDNAETTIQKVKELGGMVHMTRDLPQGTIVMIADPSGASFIGIKLNVPAQEWIE